METLLLILFWCVCALVATAGWWMIVRITAHAWRGPQHWQGRAHPVDPVAALVTRALAPPRPLDRTLMQPAVSGGWAATPPVQPGRASAPAAGGLCVVGHYIEPRYSTCYMGHKFNEPRTVAASRGEIEAAAKAADKEVRDRAAGAPW